MSIIDLKIDKLSYQADLDRHYFLSHFFTDDAFEHIIDFLLEDESCIYYEMLSESINDDFIELLSPSLAMRILFPTYHDFLNNEICESYLLDNSIYIPCKENVVIGLFANCVIQPLSINAISEASRSLTEGVNSHEIEALKSPQSSL